MEKVWKMSIWKQGRFELDCLKRHIVYDLSMVLSYGKLLNRKAIL